MARSTTKISADPLLRFHLPKYSQGEEAINNPNQWFANLFPDANDRFGPAFMESTYVDQEGLTHFVPAYLNDDFFACVLDGDRHLGHQVVYQSPENTFYFYDPVPDAFCPTTDAKLKLLVSNYLIRCSQDCGELVEISNLVVAFRQDGVLDNIIEKAKAMRTVDRSFFEGKHGRKRMIDGKLIDPNADPSYLAFVKKGIVRQEEAKLTVGDAFHRYYQFCKDHGEKPLTRADFKELVAEVIREEFRIGLRHDILDDRGKQQHGWLGIDCRLGSPASTGLN